ncbi:MAG: SDR family NAD(P)-dependent oxidoreductase [Chloroflexota bacterium]
MENILEDKVILVTGGTGSIGSEIVAHCLTQKPRKVIVFSRDEIKHFILQKKIGDARLESVVGDTRNLRSFEGIFYKTQVDIIYHAAAMKHVVMCEDAPMQAVETNILGTQNVVDMALKYRVPRVTAISTDKAAYPVNVMGATKFIAERIMLNASRLSAPGQAFSCVRFGNVANSRGSVIPICIDNLQRHRTIEVTNYDVTRFIMTIPEATRLVIEASEYARGGEIFILKMKAFRLGDLMEVMLDRIVPRLGIARQNIKVRVIGLVKGEKLHENLINNVESRHVYQLNDMYVIPENESALSLYPGIKKVELKEYSSRSVPLITRDEIEGLIVEYLQSYLATDQII